MASAKSVTGEALIAAGVDVGTSAVKIALVRTEDAAAAEVLGLRIDRIRRRDLRLVIQEGYEATLREAGLARGDVAYVASTGDGELVDFRRGHFYGMTTHARGAIFLLPQVRAVLDVGALHARALRIDDRSRVRANRMTSQCASGSGQFLENVARYLGVALEEVGTLSCQARRPELVSSICAVLAETDVINMVSRGIATPDILKGIHLSMAGRYLKLLRSIEAEGDAAITGGLAADVGLVEALREKVREEGLNLTIHTHPWSIYAGALGAALWGGYRHRVLARRTETAA
ncbi:MAG TPA: benzoyl-CoA reductase subunit D [Candidatus Acidoferrales bacterium]|nr:benzoyl-CoA reductase subunit D [Candidatus Acidoferrales bacterium]